MQPQTASEERGIAPRLIWLSGALAGRQTELVQNLVIGRDAAGCGLLLEDDLVSRQHASFEVDARGRVLLIDLNSTNGTYVNGERVERREIQDGDRIGFGSGASESCVFQSPAARAAEEEIDLTESPTALITGKLKQCAHCRKVIISETEVCAHCGQSQPGAGAQEAAHTAPRPARFCHSCGAAAGEAAVFCRRCGSPLGRRAS